LAPCSTGQRLVTPGPSFACCGPAPRLCSWLLRELARAGLDVRENTAPFLRDHFPFSIFGVPAVSFRGRTWTEMHALAHHSAQDTSRTWPWPNLPGVVSAVAKVLARWLPPTLALPSWSSAGPTAETARLGKELFGIQISECDDDWEFLSQRGVLLPSIYVRLGFTQWAT